MLEKRRTLCLIGFTYLVAQLLAGFMPSVAFGPLTAVFVLLFVIALLWRGHLRRALLILLLCSTVAMALVLRMLYLNVVVNPVLHLANDSGTIQADVLKTRAAFEEERVFATVRVRVWNGQRLWVPFETEIEACPRTEPGQRIQARVALSALPENEYLSNAQAKSRFVCAEYQGDFQDLGRAPGLRNGLLRLQQDLRESLYAVLPHPYCELASAMCVGERSGLSADLKQLFQQAGLSHILVVSGLHLSAIGALCYLALKRFLNRRAAAALSCLAVLLFMCVVGFTPSVVRAGCVMLLIYIGKLLKQPGDTLTSLGLAALLLCIQNPFAAQDIGLLLSFSSTLAVLFAGNVMERTYAGWKKRNRVPAKRWVRIYQTVLVTGLVTIATLPVIAAMGGGVSLFGILCNLLVLPVVPFTVLSGLLCALTGMIPPLLFLAKLLGLLCGLCIRWMLLVTEAVDALPQFMVYLSGSYAVLTSLCALAVILIAWKLNFSLRRGLALAACLAVSAMALYGVASIHVVRFAMVGSGVNPSLVVTQSGFTLVIYRSPQSDAQQIADYLQSVNRSQVDVLIDLRAEGNETALAQQLNAEECICARQFQNHAVKGLFRDIMVYMKRQENGNFVCVDVGGRRLAIASGKVDFTGYPMLDVYFGGSGTPEGLSCRKVVLPAAGTYEWAEKYPEVHQGMSEQEIWVRAGGQIKINEVHNGFE